MNAFPHIDGEEIVGDKSMGIFLNSDVMYVMHWLKN